MKRKLAFLGISILCACSLFAQGSKEKQTENSEKVITVAVQSLPLSGISAMSENSNVAARVDFSIEETLVRTDYYDGFKFKPGLAESWDFQDNRTIVFKLRKGVKFHNGDELTADDVVYTFSDERMGEDAPGRAVAGSFLSDIKSVEKIDKYTVKVTSKIDDALLLVRFASFPSQIVNKRAAQAAESFEKYSLMPVGTGPYKITEYEDSVQIVLEKFDEYWGEGKAAADKIIFKQVPELSTRIAGLRSGEFDIITEIPPDQAKAIENMKGVKVEGGPIQNIYGMFFDTTNDTMMQNPKFRKALTLSIDREKLVSSLFSNLTEVPQNWQSEIFGDMFIEDVSGVEYNVEKAKALLKEIGYNGEKVVYRSLPGYYTLEQTVAEAVVQMWKQAGINVELQIKENWTQILEDNNDRNIYNASFSAYYPDPVGQFWRRFSDKNNASKGFVANDEFVRLGRILESDSDTQVRRDTFRKMMNLFADDPNGLYLYNLPMIYGVRENLQWSPLPVEGMDFTINAVKGF